MKLRLILLFCFAVLSGTLCAQQPSPQEINHQGDSLVNKLLLMNADDYLSLKLPPLGTLIDNASEAPAIKYYESLLEEAERGLKSEKRGWMKYLRGTAGYQYGQMNTLSWFNNYENGESILPPTTYDNFQNRKQSYWNVGGVLSIPLNDLLDRRNSVRLKKQAVQTAEYDRARWKDELTLKIIDTYTAVLENLSLIKSQSETVTLASAQYKITELDFINGKIDAQTLSRQKNIQMVAIREYESTRMALNNALLRLEVLSHTKILTK